MKHPPKSVLALDVGSWTLLWVEATCSNHHIVWGKSGAITLELGQLLVEPDSSSLILPRVLYAIQTLGRQFTGKMDAMMGVLTGALRELPGVSERLIAAGKSVGMMLRVVTSEEEGQLAWLGAADLFPQHTGAVLDLGGHTAQLVSGRQGNITVQESLPIGCQTTTWQFFHHNPPAQNEISHLYTYVNTMLSKSGWHLEDDEPLAIAGGTATAWASLVAGADTYRPDLIHGLVLSRAEGEKLIQHLSSLPTQEISNMLKSDPGRASVFLAGFTAIVAVMRHLRRDNAIHTARSVRHGLACKALGI